MLVRNKEKKSRLIQCSMDTGTEKPIMKSADVVNKNITDVFACLTFKTFPKINNHGCSKPEA